MIFCGWVPTIRNSSAMSEMCQRVIAPWAQKTKLVLRPLKRVPFVAELPASSFTVELPGDLDAITIHPSIPGRRFPAQSLKVRNAPLPQTLAREIPISISVQWCSIECRANPIDRRAMRFHSGIGHNRDGGGYRFGLTITEACGPEEPCTSHTSYIAVARAVRVWAIDREQANRVANR